MTLENDSYSALFKHEEMSQKSINSFHAVITHEYLKCFTFLRQVVS